MIVENRSCHFYLLGQNIPIGHRNVSLNLLCMPELVVGLPIYAVMVLANATTSGIVTIESTVVAATRLTESSTS